MSDNRLVIGAPEYGAVRRHLLQNRLEQVAFVFAQAEATGDGVHFRADDYYLVPPEDFDVQSEFHVSLTDEAQARIIKMAWDRRAALVDIHSHPRGGPRVKFSPSDLAGFGDFVPHVRWRLKGQPYLALVVAPSSFDALVWSTGADVEPLAALEAGRRTHLPTNLTLAELRRADGRRAVQ